MAAVESGDVLAELLRATCHARLVLSDPRSRCASHTRSSSLSLTTLASTTPLAGNLREQAHRLSSKPHPRPTQACSSSTWISHGAQKQQSCASTCSASAARPPSSLRSPSQSLRCSSLLCVLSIERCVHLRGAGNQLSFGRRLMRALPGQD
jgi:hypothetical protein